MAHPSLASKTLRGKQVPVPANMTCSICGISKPLENSHIIPKNKLYHFLEIDRKLFIDQDSDAVIPLCRNHHKLYEDFQLDPEDFFKIRHVVFAAVSKLLEYMATVQSTGTAVTPQFYQVIAAFIHSFDVYGERKER